MRASFSMLALLFAGMLCCTGCAYPRVRNWTEQFERNPELMEKYPGLGALRLGTLYETQRDMVLVGRIPKGYYGLTDFGFPGKPRSINEYREGNGKWRNFYGVVEKGALIRAHRVTSWHDRFGSGAGWFGIVYRIETEPHVGVLLSPGVHMINRSIDNPLKEPGSDLSK